MTSIRVCLFLLLSATLLAQEPPPFALGPPNGEVPAPNVTFERLVNANKEPQNWLTYSGGLSSQRHSLLTTIRPTNARDLELKWVYQTRSLERHQVTPLVVDGTMYTIQSPNDVIALNATTGKQIWAYSYTPDPAAKNCCGRLSRGVAISGDTIFLASFDARIIASVPGIDRDDPRIEGGKENRDRCQERTRALEDRTRGRPQARLRIYARAARREGQSHRRDRRWR